MFSGYAEASPSCCLSVCGVLAAPGCEEGPRPWRLHLGHRKYRRPRAALQLRTPLHRSKPASFRLAFQDELATSAERPGLTKPTTRRRSVAPQEDLLRTLSVSGTQEATSLSLTLFLTLTLARALSPSRARPLALAALSLSRFDFFLFFSLSVFPVPGVISGSSDPNRHHFGLVFSSRCPARSNIFGASFLHRGLLQQAMCQRV